MLLYAALRSGARATQTMSRTGPKSLAATRHVRGLLTLLAVACCALSTPCTAGRPVRVYEGASVIADAARYVGSYATGPRGEAQVVFDAAAVERAISAAGRSLWQRERPFPLVVLDPPRAAGPWGSAGGRPRG